MSFDFSDDDRFVLKKRVAKILPEDEPVACRWCAEIFPRGSFTTKRQCFDCKLELRQLRSRICSSNRSAAKSQVLACP